MVARRRTPPPLARLLVILTAFVVIASTPQAHQSVLGAPLAVGHTYLVISTADLPDADQADGKCAAANGACTLRAAVMQANFDPGPDTIIVPAGVFLLTRVGFDTNAVVGDLDIQRDLTIQGAGSAVTIIDGNGSVTHDRVFHILSTAQNVTLTGLTIRNGQASASSLPSPDGGGLYLEGAGHLLLRDVIVASNTAQNGGGLSTNFSSQGGSLELDNVIVHANTVTAGGVGAGGGVYASLPSNLGQIVLQSSQVSSNTADGTGGGLYVTGNTTAQWRINASEIYSNTAGSGGAIGNFVPLTLSDSHLHDNHVTFDGGAIEAFARYTIVRTTLDANSANRFGGGLFDLQTSSSAPSSDFAHIVQSTLSGNSAQYGGGIYHDGFITTSSLLTLINSTLSGNSVSRPAGAAGTADGGGLYVYGGQAQLLNATVASNRVQLPFNHSYTGTGGGLYLTNSATFTGQNSVIAKNVHGNGITLDVEDDCFSSGTVGTLAYNLILDVTSCFVTGPQGGNIVGQDPVLGPLQINGGSTQTRALLPGSPAIDAGAPLGCTDDLGAPLTTDQRGIVRPQGPACDIGAFEVQVPTGLAFSIQPGGGTAGNPLSPQPAVRVQDTFGASVAPYTGSISLAIGTNPSGGTLGGTTTLPASNGIASFSGLSIDQPGNGYTLVASAAGLPSATSLPFNVAVRPIITPRIYLPTIRK